MSLKLQHQINYWLKHIIPKWAYPLFLKYKYYLIMGKKCNLVAPTTYTEKMQWAKLHRDNRKLANYADKLKVREYVKDKIGDEYLIPLIGDVYESANNIDFGSLPDKFVIKANHGCGFNYIVTDKSGICEKKVVKTVDSWLKKDISYSALELQYRYIKPKVYIEKYIVTEGMKDLPDYKFFCFNGRVFCLYVMIDTLEDHHKSKLGIFDRDFQILPYYRADFAPIKEQLPKPLNYDKMIELAESLSEGFSHVRVDLYDLDGDIYFGEMTFTTAGGLFKHIPEEFDLILGNQWDLNKGL